MALSAGVRIGVYEIAGLIGAGGLGEVYRATDTNLKRAVAIKVLPESVAADRDRLLRFQREAEVLASLNHPNIAAIYGLERSDGTTALVMELVEGPTLADQMAQGPIPLNEALQIAKQIAEALEAAHERGIIHRDLKPANIKLRDDGTVKVLDFGLAKAIEPPASSQNVTQSPTITSPAMMTGMGMILGTAAYMSPEQARGNPADKRADIWAFGCVLYEMLTGKRSFDGEDVTEVLAAVVRGEPDWAALPSDVPEHIRLLIRRCLEKDRSKRVVHIAIARFLIVEPIEAWAIHAAPARASAPAPRPVWRRVFPALASAIFASVFVGSVVWEFRPAQRQTVTRFTYSAVNGPEFAGRNNVAISPDGTQMAYVANQRLYLRSSWDVEATPIRGAEGQQITTPVFSPDGRSIAFFYGSTGATGGGFGNVTGQPGTLAKIPTSGGVPVTLCEAFNPHGMSWDGDSILFGQAGKGILRVSANGGAPEVLAAVKDSEIAHGPQMLPGGRFLLYTLASGTDWDNAQIVAQTLGSAERKTVIKGGADGLYLSTGHIVFAVGGVLFAVPIDVRRLEVVGEPVPVVQGVQRSGQISAAAHFAVSRTGSLVYVPGSAAIASGRDVALLDRKGAVERLKLPARAYEFPRVSPNGRWLAVGINDGKESNVWIYDLSGATAIRRLTFGGNSRHPIWTSDSARVLFQSDREGDRAIFWQRADGTGTAERLTRPEQGKAHIPETWSPKGDSFLFRVDSGSMQSLWMFSMQDRQVAPFGSVPSSSVTPNAAFSPDGRWVAYASTDAGGQAVFVQPYPPTGARYQIGNGNNPFWAPDGKELFFSIGGGPLFIVNVNTQPAFTFGSPMAVPRPEVIVRPTERGRNYDIAPDGRRFVIIVGGSDSPDDASSAPRIQVVLNWFEELKRLVPTK